MKKQTVMKFLAVILLGLSVVWTSPSVRGNDGVLRIGILQLADHGALDEAREGFINRLAEQGYVDGQNIQIQFLNAQSDQSNLQVMSQRLVADQSDLILGIATPAVQALANETTEIPILGTPLTSFVTANLVESDERPNTNVTGTSNLAPIDQQLELLTQLVPSMRTLGFIFNAAEDNASLQVEIAEEEARKLGLETIRMTVANTNDIPQAMRALVAQVDAVYIPTDNTLVQSMSIVGQIAKETLTPVMAASTGATLEGGLATLGVDHYLIGRMTADMAIDIIENGARPQTMPIQRQSETTLVINEEMVEALGIVIPQSIRDRANSQN